jgi:hypothetical protein
VSHKARADHGTEPSCGQRFSLPSVQDCYHCANRCLDMWNDSVDHAGQSWLLRMADAWLQLAFELADAAQPARLRLALAHALSVPERTSAAPPDRAAALVLDMRKWPYDGSAANP